ncbi:MAG: hypothetical protein ACYDD5_01105 [Sulfuricurvum sp.]
MIIIKFSVEGLIDYSAGKNDKMVYVSLLYDDGYKTVLKENIGNKVIEHYKATIMRKMGWVSFFEISEVFGISDHEKKEIKRSKEPKLDEEVNIQVKTGKPKTINVGEKMKPEDADNDDWFN